MKKSPHIEQAVGEPFAVGTAVMIVRPSPIWFGYIGTVESVKDGIHRLAVTAENGAVFHTDQPSQWLRLQVE